MASAGLSSKNRFPPWLWGYLLPPLFFGFILAPKLLNLFELAQHGVPTQGVVTKTTVSDHAYVYYTFETPDSQATGRAGAGTGGTPPFEALGPGSIVPVVYIPARPSLSTLGDPGGPLVQESVLGIAFMAVSSLLFGTIIRRRYRG